MRKSLLDQMPLVPGLIDHPHAHELAAISAVLDRLPEAVKLVYEDLCWRGGNRVDPRKGRDGLAAEQVLRIGVLKQITGFSYELLRFQLLDSNTYRTFCRIGYDECPVRQACRKPRCPVGAERWWSRTGRRRAIEVTRPGHRSTDLGGHRNAKWIW